jgi:rubrerythrin
LQQTKGVGRLKVWRCRICGDSCVGTRRPSHCPFCGAHEKFILPASEWARQDIGDLSAATKKSLEQALGVELSAANFYACAADITEEPYVYAAFRALSMHHSRFASIVRGMLGLARPSMEGQGTCQDSLAANLEEACNREENAVNLYRAASEKAAESQVREAYGAFLEVGEDHLTLLRRLVEESKTKIAD